MKTLFLAALLSTPLTLQANQTESTSTLQFSTEEAEMAPRGFIPYLGLSGGYTTSYESDDPTAGPPASLKLLGSYYAGDSGVYDLGYGVNNQQFTNNLAPEAARTEGALELAARYRWQNRWQAGVVANHFFDMGDAYQADQADAQFVGLQVLKEFNMTPGWLARVGGRWQALTNNVDTDVNMFLVDLQIGWNPAARKPSVRSAEAEAMGAEAVAAGAGAVVVDQLSLSAIGGEPVQFDTAKSKVPEDAQARLEQIADTISNNPGLVERIEVRGYADASGNEEQNLRLSEERANEVRSILQERLDRDIDVIAIGEGATGNTKVLPEDRRAEVIFMGVTDEQALRDALSTVE